MEQVDRDRKQRILHERAAILARDDSQVTQEQEGIDVTVFHLAREVYAVESRYVSEIVPLKGYTKLPCVPPFVAGIMNFRGRILSLVDLHRLFNLPGEAEVEGCKVLFLADGEMAFGVMVDTVAGVARIDLDAIQNALPTLQDGRDKYLHGVTGDRLILLDARRLINDPALVVAEEIS